MSDTRDQVVEEIEGIGGDEYTGWGDYPIDTLLIRQAKEQLRGKGFERLGSHSSENRHYPEATRAANAAKSLAKIVENHSVRDRGVGGSNPLAPTI